MRTLHLPDLDWVGDRQPVNIAVVGDTGHGKTTLIASLLRAQNRRLGIPLPEGRGEGFNPVWRALQNDWQHYPTHGGTWVKTATDQRVLHFIDGPGGEQGLVDAIRLLSLADGVVFVVSCRLRVTHFVRSLAYAAAQAGIRHVIGFVNIDGGSLLPADGVEIELRRVLIEAGFPGDDVAVVRGSGRAAMMVEPGERFPGWIDEMIRAIETGLPTPIREEDEPFRMLVADQNISRDPERPATALSYFLAGMLGQGRLAVGMVAEWAPTAGQTWPVTIIGIQRNNQSVREAGPGDWIHVQVEGMSSPGTVLSTCEALVPPGSWAYKRKAVARLRHLGPMEGGRSRSIPSGMQPHFSMGNAMFQGRIRVLPGGEIGPGETGKVEITIPQGQLHVEPGQGFVCRQRGRVFALGWIESMVE